VKANFGQEPFRYQLSDGEVKGDERGGVVREGEGEEEVKRGESEESGKE